MILKLVAQLKNYGIDIVANEIFKYPRLVDLSIRIDQNTNLENNISKEIIIQINNEKKGKPLFLIHESSGDAFQYEELVKHINLKIPIYGIDASSQDYNDKMFNSIESLATHYVNEIRKIQKKGPYRLLGWSLGGKIAFEVGKQFVGMNMGVDFIGLIDTSISKESLKVNQEQRTYNIIKSFFRVNNCEISSDELYSIFDVDETGGVSLKNQFDNTELVKKISNNAKISDFDSNNLLRRLNLANKLSNASNKYSLKKFYLPIHYFSADNNRSVQYDAPNNVRKVLGNNITLKVITNSDHHNIIKKTKYAKIIGKHIEQTINQLNLKTNNTATQVQPSYKSIISIQNGKEEKSPVYFIPGAGGSIGGLIELTKHFDNSIQVFGIIPRGLENELVPHTTVEASANYYVKQICKNPKKKSLNLLGHSYGGWVAVEMAIQLMTAGHNIPYIILLDSSAPNKSPKTFENPRLYGLSKLIQILELQSPKKFGTNLLELIGWEEEKQIQMITKAMREMEILSEKSNVEDIRRMVQLFILNATTNYNPVIKYHGKVLLIQALDDTEKVDLDQNAGLWKEYLTDLEVIRVPGNHLGILQDPNAIHLAELIQKRLYPDFFSK